MEEQDLQRLLEKYGQTQSTRDVYFMSFVFPISITNCLCGGSFISLFSSSMCPPFLFLGKEKNSKTL